ncbi:MAG: hypothetical protein LBS18_08225 [Clostridiales bacterium]|jgi:hypothetical protein|nr:hypothetical protein [Clostridiales bacterium]
MKSFLKIVILLVIAALLVLVLLSYLEKRGIIDTSASSVLSDIKDAGEQAGDSVSDFLDESGIKDGTADLLEQGAALIRGSAAPEQSTSPESAPPTPSPTPYLV